MAEETRAAVRSAIERMLRPRSIAIVGASPTPGALGAQLLANIPRVKAQRIIFEGRTEGYADQLGESIYNLYMTAYGDERLAQRAQTDYLDQKVDKDCNAAAGR